MHNWILNGVWLKSPSRAARNCKDNAAFRRTHRACESSRRNGDRRSVTRWRIDGAAPKFTPPRIIIINDEWTRRRTDRKALGDIIATDTQVQGVASRTNWIIELYTPVRETKETKKRKMSSHAALLGRQLIFFFISVLASRALLRASFRLIAGEPLNAIELKSKWSCDEFDVAAHTLHGPYLINRFCDFLKWMLGTLKNVNWNVGLQQQQHQQPRNSFMQNEPQSAKIKIPNDLYSKLIEQLRSARRIIIRCSLSSLTDSVQVRTFPIDEIIIIGCAVAKKQQSMRNAQIKSIKSAWSKA